MTNEELQALIASGDAIIDTSNRADKVQQDLEKDLESPNGISEEGQKELAAMQEAFNIQEAFPTGFMDPALYGPEVEDTPFIGTLESFSSSFALGKDMIEKSFWEKMEADAEQGVGFGSIMSSFFGKEFIPDRIEDNIQDIERNYQELSRKYEEKPLELADSWKNPERFFGHDIPLLLGQSLPSVILPLTASAVGGIVGGAATGGPGAVPGAIMAGMAAQGIGVYQEAMAEAGEVLKGTIEELERQHEGDKEWTEERIRKEAFDKSEKAFDRQAAFLAASEFPQLLLNIIPPAKMLATIGVKGTTAFTKQMAKNALKYPRATNVAKLGQFVSRNVLFEGGQEGTQYYLNQDILNESRDETTKRDLSWNGLWDDPEFIENVKAGGLMGVMLGGGFSTVNSLMTKQVNDLKSVPIDDAFNQVNNQKELLYLNAISTNNQFTLIGQIEMMRENGLFNDENLKGKEQEKAAKKYADDLIADLDLKTQIWDEWNSNKKVSQGRDGIETAQIKMRGYFNAVEMGNLKDALGDPANKNRTKQQQNEIRNKINILNTVNTSLSNGLSIEKSEESAVEMAKEHNIKIIDKEAKSIVEQQENWKRKWKPETIEKWAEKFSFEDIYTPEQVNESIGGHELIRQVIYNENLKALSKPKETLIDKIANLLNLKKKEETKGEVKEEVKEEEVKAEVKEEEVKTEVKEEEVKVAEEEQEVEQETEQEKLERINKEAYEKTLKQEEERKKKKEPLVGPESFKRKVPPKKKPKKPKASKETKVEKLYKKIKKKVSALDANLAGDEKNVYSVATGKRSMALLDKIESLDLLPENVSSIKTKQKGVFEASAIYQKDDAVGKKAAEEIIAIYNNINDRRRESVQGQPVMTKEDYENIGMLLGYSKEEIKDFVSQPEIKNNLLAAEKTPQEKEKEVKDKTDRLLDVLQSFNKQSPAKRKKDSANRQRIIKLAGELGLEFEEKNGKINVKTAEGKKLGRPKKALPEDFKSLEERSPETQAYMKRVISTGKKNPKMLLGIGMTTKQIAQAIKNIEEGKDTLASRDFIDIIDRFVKQGYAESRQGTGRDAFTQQIPLNEFVLEEKPKTKKGVEISSKSKDLAAALTNPTELAKSKGNLTKSYPVKFRGKTYKDAEAAYQALKSTATKDEGPNSTYNLMADIITAKLEQHPRLVSEITKEGGSNWIMSSTHQPTKQNNVWETGGKNWFIKALNDAYLNVTKEAPTKKKTEKPSNEEILNEDIQTEQEEKVEEEVKEEIKKEKTAKQIRKEKINAKVAEFKDQAKKDASKLQAQVFPTPSPELVKIFVELVALHLEDVTITLGDLINRLKRKLGRKWYKFIEENITKELNKTARGKKLLQKEEEETQEEVVEDQEDSIRFDESKSRVNLNKILKILDNIEGLDRRNVVKDLLDISPKIREEIQSRKEEYTYKEVVELFQSYSTYSPNLKDAIPLLANTLTPEQLISALSVLSSHKTLPFLYVSGRKRSFDLNVSNRPKAEKATIVKNQLIYKEHESLLKEKVLQGAVYAELYPKELAKEEARHLKKNPNAKSFPEGLKESASETALSKALDSIYLSSFRIYLNKGIQHKEKKYRGRDKIVKEYNSTRDKTKKKELRKEIIETDLAFAEKMTGLDWSSYLNETPETSNYIEDFIEGNIEIFKIPKTGFYPLTNKITTYLFKIGKVFEKKADSRRGNFNIPSPYNNFKKNVLEGNSSQIVSLSRDILIQKDDQAYSDEFQTVAKKTGNASMEKSQIIIDANNIVNKPDKSFWNDNELVKYFRDVKKSAIKVFPIDGIKNLETNEIQEKGDFSPKDFTMMQVISFIQNEKTEKKSRVPKSYLDTERTTGEYAMFIEQFGDKAQGAYISVPKWTLTEAGKQIKEIRNNKTKKKYINDQFPTGTELRKWTREFEKWINDAINKGRIKESDLKEETIEKFAGTFVANWVVNKHYSDLYFQGKPEAFSTKDGILQYLEKQVKRAQSRWSPGIAPITNIKGGLPNKIKAAIVEDPRTVVEILGKVRSGKEGHQITDGLTLYRKRIGEQSAVSFGSILSKDAESFPFMKLVYSEVRDNGMPLQLKSMWLEVDSFAETSPMLQSALDYMNKHEIDVLAFDSAAKLHQKSEVNSVFNEEGIIPKNAKTPVTVELNTNYLLMQQDFRKLVAMQSGKRKGGGKQPRRANMFFPSTIAKELNTLYNTLVARKTQKARDTIEESEDTEWLKNIHNKIGDEPANSYMKDLSKDVLYHPHMLAEEENYVARSLVNKSLESVVQGQVYQSVPDMGFVGAWGNKLQPMRIAHKTTKERISFKKWQSLSDTKKKEYKILSAQALVPKNSGLKIGEKIFSTRVPYDGFHNQTMMEVVGYVPESMENILVIDPVTQLMGGEDNDGDNRHVWAQKKNEKGNPVKYDPNKIDEYTNDDAIINKAFDLTLGVYEDPINYEALVDPIEGGRIDEHIEHIKEKESAVNKYNPLDGILTAYQSVNDTREMKGIIAVAQAAFSYLASNGISLKNPIKIPKIGKDGKIKKVKGKDQYYTLQNFYESTDPEIEPMQSLLERAREFSIIANENMDAAKLQNTTPMGLVKPTVNSYVLLAMLGVKVEDIIGFYNQATAKAFIEEANEGKSVVEKQESKDVLKRLQARTGIKYKPNPKFEYGLSSADMISMMTYLEEISKGIMAVNVSISATEQASEDFSQLLVRENGLNTIESNTSDHIDFTNAKSQTEKDSFLYGAREANQTQRMFYEKKRPIGLPAGANLLNRIKTNFSMIFGRSDYNLSRDKVTALETAMNKIWFGKAIANLFSKEEKVDKESNYERTKDKIKELIYEDETQKFKDNKLLNVLEIDDSAKTIKLRDDIASNRDMAPEERREYQQAFSELPDELKRDLMLYNFHEYGYSKTTFNGGFSIFVDQQSNKKLAESMEKALDYFKQENITEELEEQVMQLEPSLIPQYRSTKIEKGKFRLTNYDKQLIFEKGFGPTYVKDKAEKIYKKVPNQEYPYVYKDAISEKELTYELVHEAPTAPTKTIKPKVDSTKSWSNLKTQPVYTKEGVNTMRTIVAKPDEHFGNPVSETGVNRTIKVKDVPTAVQFYKDWLLEKGTTKDYGINPKEFIKKVILSVGGKPTSKGWFKLDNQHYYIPGISIIDKGGFYDAFIYIGEDEIYLGSSKNRKNFTSEKSYPLYYLNMEQNQWILDQINQGNLDNATLLYDSKLAKRGLGSHAEALAEVVQELRKKQPTAPAKQRKGFTQMEVVEGSSYGREWTGGKMEKTEGWKKDEIKEQEQFKPGKKIVSNEDIIAFNKFNKKPKEFFTHKSKFEEFFNAQTGKRQGVPQSAIWVLNEKEFYDLIDKETGETYIQNVDLVTGRKQNRIPTNPKYMLSRDAAMEELSSSDPELAEFIEKRFEKLFPGVDIRFVTNWQHEGMSVLGAAVGNTLYIDPSKAVQSTYFHEMAHMYWDALPDTNIIKKKLMKMFETEEDAILAIGRAGVELAKEDLNKLNGTTKFFSVDKFLRYLKGLWRNVKRKFGITNKSDVAKMMAADIWNNREDLTTQDFTNEELKFQKLTSGYSESEIIKEANEKAITLKKQGFDLKDPAKMARFFIAMERQIKADPENKVSLEDINKAAFDDRELELMRAIGIKMDNVTLDNLSFGHLVLKQYGLTTGFETTEVTIVGVPKKAANLIERENQLKKELLEVEGFYIEHSRFNSPPQVYQEYLEQTAATPPSRAKIKEYHISAIKEELKKVQKEISIKGRDPQSYKEEDIYLPIDAEDPAKKTPATIDSKFVPLVKTVQEFFVEAKKENPAAYGAEGEIRFGMKGLDNMTPEQASKVILVLTDEDLNPEKIQARIDSLAERGLTPKNDKTAAELQRDLREVQDARKRGIVAIIQEYKKFDRDFQEIYKNFNEQTNGMKTGGGYSVLFEMDVVSLEKLLYDIKKGKGRTRSKQAQAGFRDVVESVLASKKFTEFVNNPENDAFGTGYKLWAEAFYDMWELGDTEGKGKTMKLQWHERLMTSPKDYRDKVMQLKNYMINMTQIKAMRRSNKDFNSLIKLEKDILKEGLTLDDIMTYDKKVVDGKEYTIKRFKDIYRPEEMKTLSNSQESYLREYVRIIMSNLPEKAYSRTKVKDERSNYERNILYKLPIIKADFWELLKKHGLYKALELTNFQKSSLGSVVIKTNNGNKISLEKARIEILADKNNKVINSSEAKKLWKEYKEQASERFKIGIDANGNALFNATGITVPLSGINFQSQNAIEKDAISSNLSATVRNYVRQLTYKHEMEQILPLANYFNKYYKHNTNEHVRKMLENYDNERFFRTKPDSAVPKLEKALRFMTGWTAMRYLALNFAAPIFNMSAGQSQNFIDLSPKFWALGMARLAKNPLKAYNIMKNLEIVNTSIDAELSLPQAYWRRIQRVLFVGIEIAENLNQAVPFLGMMGDKYDHYGNDGFVKKDKAGLTPNEQYNILSQVQRTHGPYHPLFRRQINLTAEGQAFIQFKGWMPEMFLRYFQREFVDEFGRPRKGIMRTLWEPESRKSIGEFLQGKRKFADLSQTDKENMGRGLRTITMLSMFLLILSTLDDEDDELAQKVRRMLGDVTYVFDFDNMSFLLAAPMPLASTITDLLKAFKQLATAQRYSKDTDWGKEGELKGIPSIFRAVVPFKKLSGEAYKELRVK